MMQTLLTIVILCVALPVFVICGFSMLVFSLLLPSRMHAFARVISRIILGSMGVIVKINGKFPPDGQFIVMANHSSFIDPFLLPLALRGRYTGIVADFNYKYPLWSLMLKRFRAISINRENREEAIENFKSAEQLIKKEGFHIAVLPEGTRTVTGKMGSLKKGGFHLAVNTGVPILPIGIVGAYRFKPKDRFSFRPGVVTLNIGKPIPVKNDGAAEMTDLISKVEKEIKRLSGETN